MILIYFKNADDTEQFEKILQYLPTEKQRIQALSENTRSFSLLESVDFKKNDMLVISDIFSLGLRISEIESRTLRLINSGIPIIICSYPATFEYGLNPETNHAAVMAIIQTMNRTQNVPTAIGRPKIKFPENWESLYEDWINGKISSAEFIKKSGLKRATFYNILAEYKSILKKNEEFVNRLIS